MIPILSFVQEGQLEPHLLSVLESGLSDICQSAFGAEAFIHWVEVKDGNGFSGAEPSKASLVRIQSNLNLAQEDRVQVMHQVCDLWIEKTGCSINEIVAAVGDPVN